MQFLKFTPKQREYAAWRRRRNRLVSELLAANPRMLSYEALAEANRRMRAGDAAKKPAAKASPTPSKGKPPDPARKRHTLTCRHCGRKRPAGELFCAGCNSPWVVTQGCGK